MDLAHGPQPGERRIDERLNFVGTDTFLLMDGTRFTLRLKDLSSFGLCGLTDAPVAPGQMVCMLLSDGQPLAAEIRWIRKSLIGAAFPTPLAAECVHRLRRSHGRRSRSARS
jgi:hypothetical protein